MDERGKLPQSPGSRMGSVPMLQETPRLISDGGSPQKAMIEFLTTCPGDLFCG